MILNEKYLRTIETICKVVFPFSGVCVVLFGSRARNSSRDSSDVDLAIIADSPLQKEIGLFRERLEESTIPYTFDVVEFKDLSDGFKENIEKEGIVVWKN